MCVWGGGFVVVVDLIVGKLTCTLTSGMVVSLVFLHIFPAGYDFIHRPREASQNDEL